MPRVDGRPQWPLLALLTMSAAVFLSVTTELLRAELEGLRRGAAQASWLRPPASAALPVDIRSVNQRSARQVAVSRGWK